MNSPLFKLHLPDWTKGLLLAITAPVLTALLSFLNTPGFSWSDLDFHLLFKVGLVAGLSYLIKNFFSDSEGKVFGKI